MKLTTKNEVYLLMRSTTPSAALGAVIETGLLWQLEEKPLKAPEIAQALNIPGKRCHYWLQFLDMMGILENGPNGYVPSDLVREAIFNTRSKESWQHLALDERERSNGVQNLPLYISAPGSIWAAQGLPEPKNYVEEMRASLARAREFTRMLFEVHQDLANQIAELVDLEDVQRMMDIGGGSGVVSMAFMRKNPSLTSTVVDIENVCVAGREIAAEEGLSDRVNYHPADIIRDKLPTGFDMVLQCDVGLFSLDLLKKYYGSLNPGGKLVFVGHLSPTEYSAPLTRVEWTFLDSLREPDFSYPTLAQFKAQLVEMGFEVLPVHHTIGSGWIVLQAHR